VLGDAGGHFVEIAESGWTLRPPDPARQRYRPNDDKAEAMPLPERTESSRRQNLLQALGEALNVEGPDAVLAITWLAAALAQVKALPMLTLAGQTGRGSTSFLRGAHRLIDPRRHIASPLPNTLQDLRRPRPPRGRLITYEERVRMKPPIAAGLLEMLDDTCRPVLLRCFAGHAACPVPPDRRLDTHQRAIEGTRRLTMDELDIAVSNVAPKALGLLLDLAVEGLARAKETRPAALPRSAEFYAFGVAAETLLWPSGTFAKAWAAMEGRRQDAERRTRKNAAVATDGWLPPAETEADAAADRRQPTPGDGSAP
jgi:hypothetical protein